MEKYGFVYIWRDAKHKKYYIGCHWGSIDDGYVCSSGWMMQAYRRRPRDFRRRILALITTNKADLFAEEARWHTMIKDSELRSRYYNIKRWGDVHWSANEGVALTVKQKLSASMKARHQDPEYRVVYMSGRQKLPAQTPDARNKRRISMLGKNVGTPKTEAFYDAAVRRRGRNISEDHKEKIKAAGHFKNLNTMKRMCVHCGTEASPGTIGRYHNHNCKKRTS